MLISATIAAGVDGAFAVTLEDASALLPEEETFRFALHYYGRVLYEMAHSERSVRKLPEWTSRIASTAIDRDADFFAMTDVKGALVSSLARPLALAEVALCVTGFRDRDLAAAFI